MMSIRKIAAVMALAAQATEALMLRSVSDTADAAEADELQGPDFPWMGLVSLSLTVAYCCFQWFGSQQSNQRLTNYMVIFLVVICFALELGEVEVCGVDKKVKYGLLRYFQVFYEVLVWHVAYCTVQNYAISLIYYLKPRLSTPYKSVSETWSDFLLWIPFLWVGYCMKVDWAVVHFCLSNPFLSRLLVCVVFTIVRWLVFGLRN